MVTLGAICELYQPKIITQQDLVEDGPYSVFGANGVIGRYNQYNHEDAEVLITCRGATCGTINKSEPKIVDNRKCNGGEAQRREALQGVLVLIAPRLEFGPDNLRFRPATDYAAKSCTF